MKTQPKTQCATAKEGMSQTVCPVLGNPVNKAYYADVDGKRVYFCCAACKDKFMQEPAPYLEKMQKEGVKLEDAPTGD